MNDDVFRFIVTRAAEKGDATGRLSAAVDSDFQGELADIRATDDLEEMESLARDFRKSDSYVTDLGTLDPLVADVVRVFEERAASPEADTAAKIRKLLASAGDEKEALIDPDAAVSRLADSLVSAVVLGEQSEASTMRLAINAVELITNPPVAEDSGEKENARRAFRLDRPVALPEAIFPLPFGRPVDDRRKDRQNDQRKLDSADGKQDKATVDDKPVEEQIGRAEAELSALPPDAFSREIPEPADTHENVAHQPGLLQRALRIAGFSGKSVRQDSPRRTDDHRPSWTVNEEYVNGLSNETTELLAELKLDPSVTPLPRIMEGLSRASAAAVEASPAERLYSVAIGSNWHGSATFSGSPPAENALNTRLNSESPVMSVVVADLMVVRQTLLKYDTEELAHIENVLEGEHRRREHRRKRETEEILAIDRETNEESERNLVTAEQFEMQRETEESIREESSLEAGVKVSASYGPWVSVEAHVDYASERASERSERASSRYARSITETAKSKVQERVREQRTRRTLDIIDEFNLHEIDNPAGNGHIVGMYEFVDKFYDMQIQRYGKRLMLDFEIPEPAAFFLHSLVNAPDGARVPRPADFSLDASQITIGNYRSLARAYEVTDIAPPPDIVRIVSHTFDIPEGPPNQGAGFITGSTKITIPEGYAAHSAVYRTVTQGFQFTNTWSFELTLGLGQSVVGSNGFLALPGEIGELPVAYSALRFAPASVNIEVLCQRTARALEEWQIATHGALLTGYLNKLADYNEDQSAQEIQEGISIGGRNPAQNRALERTELKKHALSLLTGQHFDLFDAMELDAGGLGYPQPNLVRSKYIGRAVRFLEQAFEWPQMMFLLRDYFYGRKSRWLDLIHIQDNDPQHTAFLKAGGARVTVPVRPGFEPAVLHFLETRRIWGGEDPPTIGSPPYLDIVDEIRAQQDEQEPPVDIGPSWTLRLPTPMVLLKNNPVLTDNTPADNGAP
ncbi:MAG: hypothetical protein AAFX56_10580 [Pseudomonadota bacterium]